MSLIKARPTAENDFDEDPRYRIATREMWIAVAYWVVYTVAVTGVAWSIGHGKPASDVKFIMGFPDWFFWSAGVTTLIFCIIPYFITKYLFVDCSLSPDLDDVVTAEQGSNELDGRETQATGEGS